ncbi:MAG: hypothetical protein R3A79_16560 [Nannocystaceae bacterium]
MPRSPRPSRHSLLRAAALCGLSLVACTNEVDLEALPRALSDAYCERAIECGEFDDADLCARYYGIEQDFENWWLTADVRRSLDSGVTIYNGEAAYACVEAVRAASCLPLGFERALYEDACAEIFEGTLADGELCWADAQCGSLACDIDYFACDQACCAGTCTPTPRAVLGEPCPAGYCVDDSICGDDLVCVPRQGIGAGCVDDYECADDLTCLGDTCTIPREFGQLCLGEACGDIGLTCDTTRNTCVGVLYAGALCNPDVDLCGAGLHCDPNTNTCRGGPGVGGACVYDCDDASLYCDGAGLGIDGTCRQLKADGAPCFYGFECQSWYCDDAGLCADEPGCAL